MKIYNKIQGWWLATKQYKYFFCPHPYFIMWGNLKEKKFFGFYKENKNQYGGNIGAGYIKIFEFHY